MNEEEKEAIECLKLKIKKDNSIIQGMFGDIYDEIRKDNKAIETLITVCDKQQKEIEELRNPSICGRTIDEIVNILTGLDIEKQYKIDVTMKNLKSLMGIYQAEVEKSIQNAQIKIVDDLLGKGSKIEFELPHYNFDEENKI